MRQFLFFFSFYLSMPFLIKEVSHQPCILDTSNCPSHNVLHEINDYLFYYDPIYCTAQSTTNGKPLFHLQKGSHNFRDSHCDICHSCLPLHPAFELFADSDDASVHYSTSIFDIKFCRMQIHFLFSYIKSSFFHFVIYIVYLLL